VVEYGECTRYEVVIGTLDGADHRYTVGTFFGEAKAVAVAACVHAERQRKARIFTIEVINLGPPNRERVEGDDWVWRLESDDLTDRAEW
jgi:hypothetical protein